MRTTIHISSNTILPESVIVLGAVPHMVAYIGKRVDQKHVEEAKKHGRSDVAVPQVPKE